MTSPRKEAAGGDAVGNYLWKWIRNTFGGFLMRVTRVSRGGQRHKKTYIYIYKRHKCDVCI